MLLPLLARLGTCTLIVSMCLKHMHACMYVYMLRTCTLIVSMCLKHMLVCMCVCMLRTCTLIVSIFLEHMHVCSICLKHMSVCMCVCTEVFFRTHEHTQGHTSYACVCVCIHICAELSQRSRMFGCVFICICICIYIYIYTHTQKQASIFACFHVSVFVYVRVCMYIYIYIYINTYIHTYIHTCIHTYTEVLETTREENLAMIKDTVAYLKGLGKEVMLDAEHYFDGVKANRELTCVDVLLQCNTSCILVCVYVYISSLRGSGRRSCSMKSMCVCMYVCM
jgi:hypothetical protein